MSLPIGHAAIGFASYSLSNRNESPLGRWKVLIGVLVLSNLPDGDVILGILLQGNGSAFHRGPTHSLIFAIIGAILVSGICRLYSPLPKFSFRNCFLLILSHLFADAMFTSSPISFFWPIAVNWNEGYSGLGHVLNLVLFGNGEDAKIIVACAFLIPLRRILLALGVMGRPIQMKRPLHSSSPR